MGSVFNSLDWQLCLVGIGSFVFIGTGLAGMILLVKSKLVRQEPCKIFINENPDLTKQVYVGSTLLNALLSEQISVPSPCGGKATCKQCKVQVVEGAGAILEPDLATFSKGELQQGWRLSCQFKIKNDIKMKIPEELLDIREFQGRVISNENVATFIKELVVELSEPLNYRAGAYLQFHTPPFRTNTREWKETMPPQFQSEWEALNLFNVEINCSHLSPPVIRAYSMASYPAEGSLLRFNIRIATPPMKQGKLSRHPWGVCSSYLFSLKKGDSISLSGPYGESWMKEGDQELVFLIGGAGSSFARSHILHLFRTEHTERKLTLWYGARSLKENIYQEEYERLAQEYSNFTYHLVLSEPLIEDLELGWPRKEEDPTRTNFLFKAFELGQLQKLENPEDCIYYVCGPPLHNRAVLALLDNYGVERANIVLDDFGN